MRRRGFTIFACKWACLLLAITLALTSSDTVWAASLPSKTQCKLWDNTYLGIFHLSVVASLFIPFLLNAVAPFVFGKSFWVMTNAGVRRFIISSLGFFLLASLVIAWPFVFGFGSFLLYGVGPDYPFCQEISFGGSGLFNAVGTGSSAISQWPIMLGFLFLGSLVGGLIDYVTARIILKVHGLEQMSRKGLA